MAWELQGEYFENCNCDVLCPCLTSSMTAPADQDRCLVPMVCRISRGRFDDIDLGGLCFVMVIDSPAVMSEGNWRVAVYIDEKANDDQRQALGAILSGEHGGVPEMLSGLVGTNLGVKYVPIRYESDGRRKRVEIEGILDVEVEGIVAGHSDDVMEIVNIGHPMGTNLPIAKSTRGAYNDTDYGFSFDNTGKNGHYRDFQWRGG